MYGLYYLDSDNCVHERYHDHDFRAFGSSHLTIRLFVLCFFLFLFSLSFVVVGVAVVAIYAVLVNI